MFFSPSSHLLMHEIEREGVGWQTDPDREGEANRHTKRRTKQARKGKREGTRSEGRKEKRAAESILYTLTAGLTARLQCKQDGKYMWQCVCVFVNKSE